ncbi:MAG: Rho termination factor N-terminal domain-containing protein [Pirellulales bacterium]
MRKLNPAVRDRRRRRGAGKRGGKSPQYEEWTKDHLYQKAQQVGIEGRSKMSKKQLVNALRNH